jgi:hypothetical protein
MRFCNGIFRLLVRSAVLLSILELFAAVAFVQDSNSSRFPQKDGPALVPAHKRHRQQPITLAAAPTSVFSHWTS